MENCDGSFDGVNEEERAFCALYLIEPGDCWPFWIHQQVFEVQFRVLSLASFHQKGWFQFFKGKQIRKSQLQSGSD